MRGDERFRARYGPWALVAGASEGLGAAFAEALAARGLHVLLVARRPGPLEALAARLAAQHGIEARALPADLADAAALARVIDAARAVEVGLLVCNAALAPVGPFLSRTAAEHRALVDVNCRAPSQLVHALAGPMADRGRGGVVILSSLAGYQGSGLVAHYAASKAYLRVLAEGLWDELRPRGVDVVASVPGPTDTPTFHSSRPRLLAPPASPAAVVEATLAGLGRTPVVVPGTLERATRTLLRLLPTGVAIRLIGSGTRRMYRR